MLALLLLWVGLSLGGTPDCGKTLLTALPEGEPQVFFLLIVSVLEWLVGLCSNTNGHQLKMTDNQEKTDRIIDIMDVLKI